VTKAAQFVGGVPESAFELLGSFLLFCLIFIQFPLDFLHATAIRESGCAFALAHELLLVLNSCDSTRAVAEEASMCCVSGISRGREECLVRGFVVSV
jgi:hypothetical protein